MEKIIIGLITGAIFGVAIQASRTHDDFKKCKKEGGKIFKKHLGKFFYEDVCVLHDKIIKGSVKIGKGEIIPPELLAVETVKIDKKPISKKKIFFALFLGFLGLVAWFLPILGLPISIYGLIIAIKGINVSKKIAIFTIVLCIIGIVLSIINASVGAYQGSTGNNARVNRILK